MSSSLVVANFDTEGGRGILKQALESLVGPYLVSNEDELTRLVDEGVPNPHYVPS